MSIKVGGPLYVLAHDFDEAMSLGARQISGDLRLYPPERVLSDVESKVFLRWQTQFARYAWCMELVRDVLGNPESVDPIDTLVESYENNASLRRVYLWVCPADIVRVKSMNGVHWDRSMRMLYASRDADLNELYDWLTPDARLSWEVKEHARISLDWLIRHRARLEVLKSGQGSGANPAPPVQQRPPSSSIDRS